MNDAALRFSLRLMDSALKRKPNDKLKGLPLVLGVDPGIHGAYCFYNKSRHECVMGEFPLKELENGRKEIDFQKLVFLWEPRMIDTEFAVVEQVHAMTYVDRFGMKRGQGAAASFSFGKSFGGVIGILSSFYLPTHFIVPSVWKSLLGLDRVKRKSRELAMKIFPQCANEFRRAKDDGKAEACLLAQFAAERFS